MPQFTVRYRRNWIVWSAIASIDKIERDFLKDLNIHLIIHLDPVITSDEKTNALKEQVEQSMALLSPDIHIHDFRVVWGFDHSNLIFDVVVPFDVAWSDEELIIMIANEIHKINRPIMPLLPLITITF